MNSKEVLSKEFELLKRDLITAYDQKGMRASGNWDNTLEVETEINHAILWGEHYSQQLETGRNPGKQPPSQAIEQWLRDKGIAATIDRNISISSLAFLIARKIGREGWNREGYGGVDLISDVVTAERLQKIIDEVGEATLIEYSTEILGLIEELAA